jgi:hypothetical protein
VMDEISTVDTKSTVSIFDILATLPSGSRGPTLSQDELSNYLRIYVDSERDKDRNRRHLLRDELYHDGGVPYMTQFIEDIFDDPTVRKLRQKWVKQARFNNAIKRIVNEQSTVYSEPARRLVPADNDTYQKLLEAIRIDERAVEIDRLLSLHRALLVGFRVRQRPNGEREPVLDIATPANVRVVMHPNDSTEVVGWMIRTEHRSARPGGDAPAWTLWTDHESMQLRADLSVIGDSVQQHPFGVCPWVPVTLGPPCPGFWPGEEGEDIVAAHIAIWFNNILLLKESKSATKQTIIQGDGTNAARGQSADSEVPSELADGQNATTVDMSMDLSLFRDTTDHVLFNASYNYGMSPAIMTHQGVQSAEARELMRIPLKEIRRQRQVPLRRFERQLAKVMSVVTAIDLPAMTFSVDGWRIEYAESETPLDPMDEFNLFLQYRGAGLDSTIEFMMRKRPGLLRAEAAAIIGQHTLDETDRIRMMRELMALSGALGANAGAQPVDNKVPRNVGGQSGPGTAGESTAPQPT